MGKKLSQQGYGKARAELDDIARRRLAQQREAALDTTQLGLGVAGIPDPSGAADAANAAISLARGDYFGFVLDGISAVPWAGDLVAKPIRGVQMGVRAWARGRKLAGFAEHGSKLVERVRKMRRKAAQAVKLARRRRPCKGCNNKYGTKTPTRGAWENPKDPGAGIYTHNGNSYRFRDGYPDFDDPSMGRYLYQQGPNRTSIEMAGNRNTDEQLANLACGYRETPDHYTWHHGDDGSSMYLVERPHHEAVMPHVGGYSIAEDPLF